MSEERAWPLGTGIRATTKVGGREGGRESMELEDGRQKLDKQPNLEENTTKRIKVDFWQVLPVMEGCNNSTKSTEQELKDRMIKQQ